MKMSLILRTIIFTILLVVNSSRSTKHQGSTLRELLQKSIIAPSWKFQSIDHKWNWHQKYSDKAFEALSIFVKEFQKSFGATKNELVRMFGEESLIESRLRPLESISQELDRDANKTINDLYDVVTWRITFPTVRQVVEAKTSFINSTSFGVAIVKCFGVCPRAGNFSVSGYRGITLIAEIDGKPLEIQLMTPYMVMWADWAYSVMLDKSLGSKKEVEAYSRQLAGYYFELDSIRDKRPACPNTLRKADMKLLSRKLAKRNKIFDAIGSPPSACQFWNDLSVNKNLNPSARREVLGTVTEQKARKNGNKLSVIDIDKILNPENLKVGKKNEKDTKGSKRTLEWPVYYYY